MNANCPVCGCATKDEQVGTKSMDSIICLRCGEYKITSTARTMVVRQDNDNDTKLRRSFWISENQGIELDSTRVRNFPELEIYLPQKSAEKLIREIVNRNPSPGEDIDCEFLAVDIDLKSYTLSLDQYQKLTNPDKKLAEALFNAMTIARCRNRQELIFIMVDYMTEELKWLYEWTANGHCTITSKGWKFVST